MNCEEFEAIGLGLEHECGIANDAEAAQRAAALEHANTCPRCAALQDSWQEARLGLEALREATQQAAAPARVEMRLRQEFRTTHRTLKTRRRMIFTAWTLATAALLVGIVSWWNWRLAQNRAGSSTPSMVSVTSPRLAPRETLSVPRATGKESASHSTSLADNEGDFTFLPGSLPQEVQDDAAIFRVRLQRRALGALGLPVNEERAGEWIQVDLLVGEDGRPQAVRVPAGIRQ